MVSGVVDLTSEPDFDSPENPFLNAPRIEIGHCYDLRSRLDYNLKRLKNILQEIEHDMLISEYEREQKK